MDYELAEQESQMAVKKMLKRVLLFMLGNMALFTVLSIIIVKLYGEN